MKNLHIVRNLEIIKNQEFPNFRNSLRKTFTLSEIQKISKIKNFRISEIL